MIYILNPLEAGGPGSTSALRSCASQHLFGPESQRRLDRVVHWPSGHHLFISASGLQLQHGRSLFVPNWFLSLVTAASTPIYESWQRFEQNTQLRSEHKANYSFAFY
jgi:hypothetical protein